MINTYKQATIFAQNGIKISLEHWTEYNISRLKIDGVEMVLNSKDMFELKKLIVAVTS